MGADVLSTGLPSATALRVIYLDAILYSPVPDRTAITGIYGQAAQQQCRDVSVWKWSR